MGGLGNQMFQYSAGRRLAYANGVELKLDTFSFKECNLRTYSLGIFNVQENLATREEVEALTVGKRSLVERFSTKILGRKHSSLPSHVREKQFAPEILNLPDNVYLDGYWQSEKYFTDIEDIIRKEFTVKTDQERKNRKLAELIASCDSVSLHIRRGDYVSTPEIRKVHGTCSLDYYFRCVDQLSKTVKNPHFFIFSDDHDWASDNLKLPHPTTLVDHNGMKAYEDLRLMSQCRHHIIANSSFSWWGAWLNKNQDKIVIAPQSWFNDSSRDTKDLIPDSWVRI
jgi:hypothetical protein